jgi:putative ABC transport system ATP-binding protein
VSKLQVTDLTVEFDSAGYVVRPLDGVSFEAQSGELVLLLGPSGCGKTTLLSTIAGILTPTAGSILVDDVEVTTLAGPALDDYRARTVGVVFQAFNLIPSLTALENVEAPLWIAGVPRARARARAAELLGLVGLDDRMGHRPADLSGGQQQRVAIARVLIAQPDVVCADEPTGNLDSRSGAEVLSFLRRSVRELGRTIIMVTHDPSAAAYADRAVLIADGRIAGDISDPTPDSAMAGLDALRTLEPAVTSRPGTTSAAGA